MDIRKARSVVWNGQILFGQEVALYAELFEEAFYEKKNLDPKMREETTTQTVDVPDDVDAELLAKVLANPEMKALLASLAKAMK